MIWLLIGNRPEAILRLAGEILTRLPRFSRHESTIRQTVRFTVASVLLAIRFTVELTAELATENGRIVGQAGHQGAARCVQAKTDQTDEEIEGFPVKLGIRLGGFGFGVGQFETEDRHEQKMVVELENDRQASVETVEVDTPAEAPAARPFGVWPAGWAVRGPGHRLPTHTKRAPHRLAAPTGSKPN